MDTNQEQSSRNGYSDGTPATGYILFIPLNRNDGQGVEPELVNWILNQIVLYAGGLTQFPPCDGYWVSPAALVLRDCVLPVQVVVPPSQEAERWFTMFA